MNKAPIDLVKLAEQTLEDVEEFQDTEVKREVLLMALYSAYRAGYEHGDNHAWHEHQEEFNEYVNDEVQEWKNLTNAVDEEC